MRSIFHKLRDQKGKEKSLRVKRRHEIHHPLKPSTPLPCSPGPSFHRASRSPRPGGERRKRRDRRPQPRRRLRCSSPGELSNRLAAVCVPVMGVETWHWGRRTQREASSPADRGTGEGTPREQMAGAERGADKDCLEYTTKESGLSPALSPTAF